MPPVKFHSKRHWVGKFREVDLRRFRSDGKPLPRSSAITTGAAYTRLGPRRPSLKRRATAGSSCTCNGPPARASSRSLSFSKTNRCSAETCVVVFLHMLNCHMRRLLRYLVLWIFIASLPVQGIAGAMNMCCAPARTPHSGSGRVDACDEASNRMDVAHLPGPHASGGEMARSAGDADDPVSSQHVRHSSCRVRASCWVGAFAPAPMHVLPLAPQQVVLASTFATCHTPGTFLIQSTVRQCCGRSPQLKPRCLHACPFALLNPVQRGVPTRQCGGHRRG